jgi:hypothetical protein
MTGRNRLDKRNRKPGLTQVMLADHVRVVSGDLEAFPHGRVVQRQAIGHGVENYACEKTRELHITD